ncbi:MAG TPA: hypothetical protein VHX63_00295 [Acidobacteriaceae bacterium]|jgi:uncharacterized membrane protein|nr:hypothetical protein [Acidobacteriaceae bacterium]
MEKFLYFGRFLFAIAMAAFGTEYCIHALSISAQTPGPPWVPGHRLVAVFFAIVLIAAAVCIVTNVKGRAAATLLGFLILVCALVLDLPKLIEHPRNPNPWTSGFELLALCGAAWVLAGAAASDQNQRRHNPLAAIIMPGRILFAFSLIVFGVQHFMYAHFVATIITPWIPGHLFWAYFTGACFIAVAVSILANQFAPLATAMLGLMFLLWVLVLHLPRVLAALHNANEWTSLFVALAMSGGSFVLAGTFAQRRYRS